MRKFKRASTIHDDFRTALWNPLAEEAESLSRECREEHRRHADAGSPFEEQWLDRANEMSAAALRAYALAARADLGPEAAR